MFSLFEYLCFKRVKVTAKYFTLRTLQFARSLQLIRLYERYNYRNLKAVR